MSLLMLRAQRMAVTTVRRAARYQSTVSSGSASSSTSIQTTDLLEYYRGLVARGDLKWDDEQVRCVMHLKKLLVTLEDYQPPLELMDKLLPKAPPSLDSSLSTGTSWFKGKGKQLVAGSDERERQLVRVLTGEEELAALQTPKGILITGPPGTGKSLLLSLFFSLLPTAKKRRHHYHAFLLSLYQQVFAEMEKRRKATPLERPSDNMDVAGKRGWKAVFAGGRWEGKGEEAGARSMAAWTDTQEAIPFVIARRMIGEYHVLYFDELQLVDASSASLLRDVLSWYWRLGGIVVSCSNRVPDDLYHHGVQKERMAGFLDALKSRCEVMELDGGVDWRQREEEGAQDRWLTGEAKSQIEERWTELLAGQEAKPSSVNVYGRKVPVPLAAGSVCRFSFEALCEEPLGPADYISLASTFRTFVIDDVPVLYLRHKNEARRLINLVDALYESRCQVVITGEATPETMFFPDAFDGAETSSATNHKSFFDDSTNDNLMAAEALSETLHEPARPNVSVYNPTTPAAEKKKESRNATGAFSVLSIFTGEDERFAYKRAVSRLIEMTRSPTYAKDEWLPLGAEGRQWERLAVTTPQSVSLDSLGAPSRASAVAAAESSTTEIAQETTAVQPPSPPTEGFAARRLDFETAFNSSLFSKAPTTRTSRNSLFILRAAPVSSMPPPAPHPFPESESSKDGSGRVPFGIMVSKKNVSNSAVERNRVRTRFKEAVRQVATGQALGDPVILPDHAYLATLNPEIFDAPFEKLCEAVRKALTDIKTPRKPSFKKGNSRPGLENRSRRQSFSSPRVSEDFADEAGYSRPDKLSTLEDRMSKGPPKIGEQHAWGMAEGWGKKAGRWGLGPKIFGKDEGKK